MVKVLLSRLGGFGGKTHTTYLNNAISAQNGVRTPGYLNLKGSWKKLAKGGGYFA